MFQNPRTQFFTTDVDSELAFAGENYQLPPDTIRARSAEALEYVGISDLAGRNLWGLSGGQLQKSRLRASLRTGHTHPVVR